MIPIRVVPARRTPGIRMQARLVGTGEARTAVFHSSVLWKCRGTTTVDRRVREVLADLASTP
jgi:hypothetical protein